MVGTTQFFGDLEYVLIGIEEHLKRVHAILDEMESENAELESHLDQIGKGIDLVNDLLGIEDEHPVYTITESGSAELERLEGRAS